MEIINIRIATVADAEFIALLARVTFTETFGHFFRDQQDLLDYYDAVFSVAKIKSSLSKANNIFWIAFFNDLPVGYAKFKKKSPSLFINSANVSQLQKIYVLKDFLSKKIGKKLQDEMFDASQKLGSDYIWLSVLKKNNRAIQFYEKSGFETVGSHTFQIGKEFFEFSVMKKDLSERIYYI